MDDEMALFQAEMLKLAPAPAAAAAASPKPAALPAGSVICAATTNTILLHASLT
jgi:hypothetical protein